MKVKLIIIGLLIASSLSGQINWKKTAISLGGAMASITLEMTGDALYDMGKESGNKSQMNWGHTLQACGYVVPLVTMPILLHDSGRKWYWDASFSVVTYGLMRFAVADLGYNLTRGYDPLYVGSVTGYDTFMSGMPPDGRAFYKTFSLGLAFVINIDYWQ